MREVGRREEGKEGRNRGREGGKAGGKEEKNIFKPLLDFAPKNFPLDKTSFTKQVWARLTRH